jgi:hypothetical protein
MHKAYNFMINGPFYTQMEEERVWEQGEEHAVVRPMRVSNSWPDPEHAHQQDPAHGQISRPETDAEMEQRARAQVDEVKKQVSQLRSKNQVRGARSLRASLALSTLPTHLPCSQRSAGAQPRPAPATSAG